MVDVRALPSEDLKLETLLSREKITHSAHYSDFVVPPGLSSPKMESCFELQNTSMHSNSKHFNGLLYRNNNLSAKKRKTTLLLSGRDFVWTCSVYLDVLIFYNLTALNYFVFKNVKADFFKKFSLSFVS